MCVSGEGGGEGENARIELDVSPLDAPARRGLIGGLITNQDHQWGWTQKEKTRKPRRYDGDVLCASQEGQENTHVTCCMLLSATVSSNLFANSFADSSCVISEGQVCRWVSDVTVRCVTVRCVTLRCITVRCVTFEIGGGGDWKMCELCEVCVVPATWSALERVCPTCYCCRCSAAAALRVRHVREGGARSSRHSLAHLWG